MGRRGCFDGREDPWLAAEARVAIACIAPAKRCAWLDVDRTALAEMHAGPGAKLGTQAVPGEVPRADPVSSSPVACRFWARRVAGDGIFWMLARGRMRALGALACRYGFALAGCLLAWGTE